MGARQTKFVTAGLILGVMGGAIALARTPQLISIESPTHEARVAQPADLRDANFSQAKYERVSDRRREDSTDQGCHAGASAPIIETASQQFRKRNNAWSEAGPQLECATGRNQQLIWTAQPAENQLEAKAPEQLVNGSQELVVLTEWTDGGAPARVVFTVIPKHQADREDRFAAVATPDGWLIVQIVGRFSAEY